MKYIVFTIDCIASKKVKNVTQLMEQKMYQLNQDPLRNVNLVSSFVVMKGDEIQGVIKYNEHFISNIRYLREACYPLKVRIGIGIGEIEQEFINNFDNPWNMNGTAFHYARESLEFLNTHHLFGKKPMSYIKSNDKKVDLILNTELLLYDALLDKWSDKTYEAVYLKEKYSSFRAIDEKEGASYSAYTKRANIGNWSIIEEFENRTKKIFNEFMI